VRTEGAVALGKSVGFGGTPVALRSIVPCRLHRRTEGFARFMISPTEKRRHPRIDLAFPVQLVVPPGTSRNAGAVVVGNAVSLNVSARGLYLRTFSSHPLSPGDRFDVRITVPDSLLRGAITRETSRTSGVDCLNVVLEGSGRIVRVERLVSFDVVGVAAAIEFDRPLELGGAI
jgi:PilZ domain-containing protein